MRGKFQFRYLVFISLIGLPSQKSFSASAPTCSPAPAQPTGSPSPVALLPDMGTAAIRD